MYVSNHASLHSAPTADVVAPQTVPVWGGWLGSWQLSLRRRVLPLEDLATAYDHEAAGWNALLGKLGLRSAYAAILSTALDRLPVADHASEIRALDCGIGTGALSMALADTAPGRVCLDGIDISPAMLKQARDNLSRNGVPAALRLGDARALPYDDATFDLVLSAHMLEHFPDPKQALTEMTRVLKPGGMLLACLTRRSAAGLYVTLKWRTHRVTPLQACGWLEGVGLTRVRSLEVRRDTLFNRLSVACIGMKLDSESAGLGESQ